MSRSTQPPRRPARTRRPVIVVLVVLLVIHLSALAFATMLVEQGMSPVAAIAATGALVGTVASASAKATRCALAAATFRQA